MKPKVSMRAVNAAVIGLACGGLLSGERDWKSDARDGDTN